MSIFYSIFKPSKPQKNGGLEGFTLLELIAVLTVLSALSAISIPNIQRWVNLSRIDESKAKVNTAIADCLFALREGKDMSTTKPSENIISDSNIGPSGYRIKNGKDSCADFMIEPSSNTENYLYSIGFRASELGVITKYAFPANNQSTLASCEKWAGGNCGVSAAQQAEWDRLAKIAEEKKKCNEDFDDWLRNTPPNGGTGSNNRWDDSKNTCTFRTWAFEGQVVSNETAYKEAEKRKLGEQCVANKQKKIDGKVFEGPVKVDKCGDTQYYFCDGQEFTTKARYDTCLANSKEGLCMNERETARLNGHTGQFGPLAGPGKCSEIVYMCDDNDGKGNIIYKDKVYYLGTTQCGAYEANERCGAKPKSYCGQLGWRDWGPCKAWCQCVGIPLYE